MSGRIRSRPLILCVTSASSTANWPCDNISVRLSMCVLTPPTSEEDPAVLGSSVCVTCRLVTAFLTSRLDYYNALLAGPPLTTIAPLQRVQNVAVRLDSGHRPRDHVTSSLRELHWLPIRYWIIFKLCLMMHHAHVGRSPRYIIDTLSPIANIPNRGWLRSSASNKYELPALRLKIGERAFSYSGHAFWNSLPSELTSIMDTQTFKSLLKTHIFSLAYDC